MSVELFLNDGERCELHDDGTQTPLNRRAEQAYLRAYVALRRSLPVARLGRTSRIAGGVLASLWTWLRLPRVEQFRRCARCHERMEDDTHGDGLMRSGTRICQGWTGTRCLILTARYG